MPRIPRSTIYWVRGDDERLNTAYLLDVPVSGVTNGQVVRYNSGSSVYVPAQASTVANATDPRSLYQAIGIIVNVSGSTGDLIVSNGKVSGFSGLTPGSTYYLSQSSAGSITATRPEHGVIVVIGVALSATTILVNTSVEESNPNIRRGQPQSGCSNGQVVRWNGTNYVPASSLSVTQGAVGMITNVSGSFGDIYFSGAAPASALTPGATYYLNNSVAGAITSVIPSSGFKVQVGVALSATTLLLNFNHGFDGMPTGTMVDFAGATAPDGWLLCDGSQLATASYGNLFAVIGYTYGGSGANFLLPDFRGRFARYNDDMGSTPAFRDKVSVTAGSFIVGRKYKITLVGTTNFTLIGAASNTVGAIFTATGVGSGTGTADESRVRFTDQAQGTAPNGMSNAASSVTATTTLYSNYTNNFTGTGGNWLGTTASGNYSTTVTSTGTAAAQTLSSTDPETRPINLACNRIIRI